MPGISRRWGLAAMVGLALLPALPVCAAENSPSGGYAELPGVKLWFIDTGGAGVPIVLLHANTGTSETWNNQINRVRARGLSGHCLRPPRLGQEHGRRERIVPQPGSIAGDLDALADYLKLKKFHLLGVAGGGFGSAGLCRRGGTSGCEVS